MIYNTVKKLIYVSMSHDDLPNTHKLTVWMIFKIFGDVKNELHNKRKFGSTFLSMFSNMSGLSAKTVSDSMWEI